MSQIEFIDIRLIDESPMNPRKVFDENSILEDEFGKNSSIKVIRAFIKNYITISNTGLKDQLSAIANEAFPDDAKRIELKHEETYLKRKESIEKQIKDLTDANT